MYSKSTTWDEQDGCAIYHDLLIEAPIEKVFAAVTEAQELEKWWPKRCTGEPRLFTQYNFFFGEPYDWYGEVVDLIPNQRFVIRMTEADDDWKGTRFGFELREQDSKVRLSFHHTGWRECNEHFRYSSFCWAMLLNGLKNYTKKGKVVPFEERE